MEGGTIAVVKDEDRISIDIPKKSITLKVPDKEIETRLSRWRRPRAKISEGYMARYARVVSSGGEGAIVR
jgi:dihydroxy-acid dehydratase